MCVRGVRVGGVEELLLGPAEPGGESESLTMTNMWRYMKLGTRTSPQLGTK